MPSPTPTHPLDSDVDGIPGWQRLFTEELRSDLRTVADAVNGEGVDDQAWNLRLLPNDPAEAASLVQAVLGELWDELRERGEQAESAVVWGWRDVLVHGWSPTDFFARNAEFFASYDGQWILSRIPEHAERSTRLARFLGAEGKAPLREAARAGLRRITVSIVDALQERRDRASIVPPVSRAEALAARDNLLPTGMSAGLNRDVRQPAIVTAVQCRAFSRLAQVVDAGESMLVIGPPGCGKTLIGQIAAAYAAGGPDGKALILFPTKALVRENLDRWTEWTAHDTSDRTWNIVAGSSDDREYDERLGSGEYDVGVCVYEKVRALLLVNPQALRDVRLLVVDELQYLNDDERGARLETLLTLVRIRYPRLPILALTGPLHPDSRRRLKSWLGLKHIVESDTRTTDLRVQMSDGSETWSRMEYGVDPRGSFPDADPAAPDVAITTTQHALDEASSRRRLERHTSNKSRRRLLALLGQVLDNVGSDPRVICFVKTRKDAVELARAATGLFNGSPKPGGNPWKVGRYAAQAALDDKEHERRYSDLKDLSDVDGYKEVSRGLHYGVAHHTADLGPELRGLLEREFTSGIIRVLFATDTLAEGVNLPASHVIVGDLLTMRRVDNKLIDVPIELARLRNRIGRAGRLLSGPEAGDAHIVLDPKIRPDDLAAEDRTRIDELRVLEHAWPRWIDTRGSGASLESRLAEDPEARHALALDAIVLVRRPTPRSEFERLIHEAFSATLYAEAQRVSELATEALDALLDGPLLEHVADPLWRDVEEARDELIDTGAVAPDPEDPQLLVVTPLGISVSRFALPVRAAPHIEDLAAVARVPVGPLSLLFHAAQNPSVQPVSGFRWWPPTTEHKDPDAVLRFVRTWAGAYAADSQPVRDERAAAMRVMPAGDDDDLTAPLPQPIDLWPDLLQRAAPLQGADPELAKWASDFGSESPENPGFAAESHAQGIALLRAVVCLEWSAAEPLDSIMLRLSSPRIHVWGWQGRKKQFKSKQPLSRHSGETLRHLVERLALVLEPVASLIDDDAEASERVRRLVAELQYGLPAWLIPLADLRVPGLGRERLVRVARLRRPPPVPLADVLEWPELGVSAAVRRGARERIEERVVRDRAVYMQVPHALRDLTVRDGMETYANLHYEIVHSGNAEDAIEAVGRALRAHRIRPDKVGASEEAPHWQTVSFRDARLAVVHPEGWMPPEHDVVLDRVTVVVPLQLPSEQMQRWLPSQTFAMLAPRGLMQLLHDAREVTGGDEATRDLVIDTLLRLPAGELTNAARLQEILSSKRGCR